MATVPALSSKVVPTSSAGLAPSSCSPKSSSPCAMALSFPPNAPLKCAVHTPEFGPLTLTALPNDPTGRPDVGSLAMVCGVGVRIGVRIGGGEEGGGEGEVEVPLFAQRKKTADSSGRGDQDLGSGSGDGASANLLRLAPDLKGLEERLGDAAAAVVATTGAAGCLEDFLSRSEAVVSELLSAVGQHRRRRLREEGSCTTTRRTGTDCKKRRRLGGAPPPPPVNLSCRYYSALHSQLSALETLPGVRTVDLSDDLARVLITCADDGDREHGLTAELPPSFPAGRPFFFCDLPAEFEPTWRAGPGLPPRIRVAGTDADAGSHRNRPGLLGAYLQFQSVLSSYQTLWNDLDEIDSAAWVLEPSFPARRSVAERRIAVRPGLSVVLSLDAHERGGRGTPVGLRLVGTGAGAGELGERVRRYVDGNCGGDGDGRGDGSWDETKSVKANLEACLGFILPSPETTEQADYVTECGICYGHRLSRADGGGDDCGDDDAGGGALPDAICCNPSCARSYHESCLFEWLSSLPAARVSFDRIFGTCPYCLEPVSTRVLSGTGGHGGGGTGGRVEA